MTYRDKNYLKTRFESGDKPSQNDFHDLIDSTHNSAGLEAVLPDQTGNEGKFFSTNGVTATWQSVPSSAVIVIPSGSVSSTNLDSAIREIDLEKLPIVSDVVVVSGGSFTLSNTTHSGKIVAVPVTGTITISPTSAYDEGFQCVVWNLSTGDVTFSGTITATGTKLPTKIPCTIAKINNIIAVSNLT